MSMNSSKTTTVNTCTSKLKKVFRETSENLEILANFRENLKYRIFREIYEFSESIKHFDKMKHFQQEEVRSVSFLSLQTKNLYIFLSLECFY